MYTVKGYVEEGNKIKHVQVLIAQAASLTEAIATAVVKCAMQDCTAAVLSPIREIIYHRADDTEESEFYLATVSEADPSGKEGKRMKYQMLFCASSFEEAQACAKETLTEGYDMELDALKKVKYHAVIDE